MRRCLLGIIVCAVTASSLFWSGGLYAAEPPFDPDARYAPAWMLDAVSRLYQHGFPGIPKAAELLRPDELIAVILAATAPLQTIEDLRRTGVKKDTIAVLAPLLQAIQPAAAKQYPAHKARLESVLGLLGPARREIETFGEKSFLHPFLKPPPLPKAVRANMLERAARELDFDAPEAALALYRDILARDPRDPDALTGLALTLASGNDLRAAETALNRALNISPENPLLLEALATTLEKGNRLDAAEAVYRRWYGLDPENRRCALAVARLCFSRGDANGALSVLNERLDRHPREIRTLLVTSRYLRDTDQPDRARYYLRQILAINPRHHEALVLMAGTYLSDGDAAGAHEILGEVPAEHTETREYLRVRAAVYHAMSDWKQSIAALNVLLAHYPDDLNARHEKARTMNKAGRQQEALDEYRALTAVHPGKPELLFETAELMVETGELEAADRTYRALLAVESGNHVYWEAYGRFLLQNNDPAAARRCFHAARRLAPAEPDAYEGLGEAAFHRGRYEEAQQYFEQTLALNPLDAAAAWYLSQLLSIKKHYGKAQTLLERFLSFAPGIGLLEEELYRVKRRQRLSADSSYLSISTKGSSDFDTLRQQFSGRFRDTIDYSASLERTRIWEANEDSLYQTSVGMGLRYDLSPRLETRLSLGTQSFSGRPGEEFKYRLQFKYNLGKPSVSAFHSIGLMEESLPVIKRGFRVEELGFKLRYPFRPWLDVTLRPSWSRIMDGTNQKRTVRSEVNCFHPRLPGFRVRFSTRFYAYNQELDSTGGLFPYFSPARYMTRSVALSYDRKIGRLTLTLGMERSQYEYRFMGVSSDGASTGYSLTAQGRFTDELYFVLYYLDSRADSSSTASDLEPAKSLFFNLSYRL